MTQDSGSNGHRKQSKSPPNVTARRTPVPSSTIGFIETLVLRCKLSASEISLRVALFLRRIAMRFLPAVTLTVLLAIAANLFAAETGKGETASIRVTIDAAK